MRLFGYYMLHSFINQLRKMLKSWVLIFLTVCIVLVALVGLGVAFISELAGIDDVEEELPSDEQQSENQSPSDEEIPVEEIPIDNVMAIVELAVMGIIAAVTVFQIIGADKNGSKIFLPADVNLLFTSPMKPQSVLLFRLMTQIGLVVISTIYIAAQLPNIALTIGLNIWQALTLILTWIFTFMTAKLLQILVYTVTSTYPSVKKYIRKTIYSVIALIAGSYLLYAYTSGIGYFDTAVKFFNHKATRWIPLIGWIKGFCMYALESNALGTAVCAALTVVGIAVLCVVIWNIKADFYEDAMAKSEEMAEFMEISQSENSVGFAKRKKDRSDKLRRDGMKYGSGANVFFFRSMYNRFRFAKFGFLTKTSGTYIFTALLISIICRFMNVNGTTPVVLAIAGLSFFRTLGNPLTEDTSKDFFRLIPESALSKLFWSVAAGTLNCLLDILPALVVACVFSPRNTLLVIAWIPFILSVDFYGSNVGAFIDFSTPKSAGKPIKQIVQIMFIYFGLLPDIALIALGFVLGFAAISVIGASVLNFALGLLFLSLSPMFLESK